MELKTQTALCSLNPPINTHGDFVRVGVFRVLGFRVRDFRGKVKKNFVSVAGSKHEKLNSN